MNHPAIWILGCECNECKGEMDNLDRAMTILDKHKIKYRKVDM